MYAPDRWHDAVMETTSEALDYGLLKHTRGGKTRIDGLIETPNQRIAIQQVLAEIYPADLTQIPVTVDLEMAARQGRR